ncbi:MAG: hypothetical protein IJU30_07865 [Lachnospiraceae bacterium]|nr:hypothetical protein [Lachnospiraceae bacterium]
MPDITFPKEFLTEALNVVDTLDADRQQLEQYNDTKKQLAKSLETLTRNIEREKTETVRSRRADIEQNYNQQIKAVESEITAINGRRQKARTEGVKSRIESNTAGLKQEIANLKQQISDYVKEHQAPGILKSRLYYSLFSPINVTDWILCIILAALLVLAIVYAYYKQVTLPVFLTVLGVIVALIAIYVAIASNTKGKHPEAVLFCKNLMKGIEERGKAIKAIARNIEKDKDDTVYNLGDYDNEFAQKNQQKADINAEKTEALNQFDNNTKQVLTGEIDAKYAEDLRALQSDIALNADAVNTFSQKVAAGEKRLNSEFVQYVGTRNLTHEKVEQMIGMIDAGEATSVSDAASKIK